MSMSRRRALLAAGLGSLASPLLAPAVAHAATGGPPATAPVGTAFPSQPVRWIVPYPPGGGTDVLARTLAEVMHEQLGQTVNVDNRAGAATIIGTQALMQSRPDGYTIMSADNATLVFNPPLYSKLPYDPVRDLSPVGLIGRFPMVLTVNPELPVRTLAEFRQWAAKTDASYASPGAGSPHHIAMERVRELTGAKLQHVPYKGAAPALQDLMSGQVQVMMCDIAAALPYLRSGRLRAIAVAAPTRPRTLPDVPTFAQAGGPALDAYAWQGLVGPKGLDAGARDVLNAALNKALGDRRVIDKFDDYGLERMPGPPEALARYADADRAVWVDVIRRQGIKLD